MESKTKILLAVISAFLLVVVIVLYVKYGKTESKDTYINNQIKYSYSTPYKESYKESHEIRENFPQTSPINVLYTDQNGNLGATSDVGINNLSVFNGSNLKGGVSVDTLNATSITSPTITASTSITSPTIDNLQSQINSLNTALTNLTSNFNYLNK